MSRRDWRAESANRRRWASAAEWRNRRRAATRRRKAPQWSAHPRSSRLGTLAIAVHSRAGAFDEAEDADRRPAEIDHEGGQVPAIEQRDEEKRGAEKIGGGEAPIRGIEPAALIGKKNGEHQRHADKADAGIERRAHRELPWRCAADGLSAAPCRRPESRTCRRDRGTSFPDRRSSRKFGRRRKTRPGSWSRRKYSRPRV